MSTRAPLPAFLMFNLLGHTLARGAITATYSRSSAP